MIQTLFSSPFQWIDVSTPTRAELESISKQYGIHPSLVNDCLDAKHPPKIEQFDGITFFVLRGFDNETRGHADSVQKLSRKVAVFVGSNFLVTVHRTEPSYLKTFFEGLSRFQKPEVNASSVACELTHTLLSSYDLALTKAETKLDELEKKILAAQGTQSTLSELSTLKRHATALKRVALHTSSAVLKWKPIHPIETAVIEDLRNTADNFQKYSEELEDEAAHLMSTQLALASHRTNEIMRVLTLFSVVFMPLTFIVGVYGMNFHNMPELSWQYGYAFAWVLMIGVSIGVLVWFRKQKWLD